MPGADAEANLAAMGTAGEAWRLITASRLQHVPLVQLVEHPAHNRVVAGSYPARRTNKEGESMTSFWTIFFVCFAVGYVSSFIAVLFLDNSNSGDAPFTLFISSNIGSAIIVLILWLIEHVRFV